MTIETQSPVNALDGVFDALVKAVADRILDQVTQSITLESKISSVMDTVLEDKIYEQIDSWFANNFSIHDYDSEINQMIDLDHEIRSVIKDMAFTVSVD
jgi:predicted subunit of tRNA(5-methylaminomethyl-2-thiouridylate) methyltransferase